MKPENIATTSAVVTHNLFDEFYEKVKGKHGVMYVIEMISNFTIQFEYEHKDVIEWEEYLSSKSTVYSDWEEYVVTLARNYLLTI